MHTFGGIFSDGSLPRAQTSRDLGQEDKMFKQFFFWCAYVIFIYVHLLNHLEDKYETSLVAEDSRVYDTQPFYLSST